MRGTASLLVAFALASVGCARYDVTRVYGGVPVEERFIDEDAYRAFVEGAEFEARGEWKRAFESFRRVTILDPRAVEAWTRLAALACRTGGDPESAFAEIERIDDSYAPAWSVRAECARARGRLDETAVRRAFELEPEDPDVGLELVTAHSEAGRSLEAERLLHELAVRHPTSRAVLLANAEHAGRVGDAAWLRRSDALLAELDSRRAPAGTASLTRVEGALAAGQEDAARQLASAARLSDAEFVALAILAANPAEGAKRAEFVVAANPAAVDVRILGALAAELASDPARSESLLRGWPPTPHDGLAPLGRAALECLVVRHGGEVAPSARSACGQGDCTERERALAERLREPRHATPRTR